MKILPKYQNFLKQLSLGLAKTLLESKRVCPAQETEHVNKNVIGEKNTPNI